MENFLCTKKAILFGSCLVAVSLLVGFVVSLPNNPIASVDQFVDQKIRIERPAVLIAFMKTVTEFGNPTQLTTIVGIMLIFFIVIKKIDGAASLALIFWLNTVFTNFLKNYFHRSRPINWLTSAGGYSYPSGHATFAAAVFLTIFLVLLPSLQNRVARSLFYIFSFAVITLVAISRVYLSVHWFSDVIGGVLFGAGLSLLVLCFAKRAQKSLS